MSQTSIRHRPHEDAIALVLGSLFVALGTAFYAKAHLLTGSTVGVALLLSYLTKTGFAPLFLLVNLPFFALAIARLGWLFTLKTLAAVALVSLFSRLTPMWIEFGHLNAVYAAVIGGCLFGIGLLILFRHGMSLGGVSILAFYLQEGTAGARAICSWAPTWWSWRFPASCSAPNRWRCRSPASRSCA